MNKTIPYTGKLKVDKHYKDIAVKDAKPGTFEDGFTVFRSTYVDREADVEELVRRWNMHDEMTTKIKDQDALLDKYDLKKFARWMAVNGYCDMDILAENGVEVYLDSI